MLLLLAEVATAVLLLSPSHLIFKAWEAACNIFMYSALFFFSYTALFTSDSCMVVFNLKFVTLQEGGMVVKVTLSSCGTEI